MKQRRGIRRRVLAPIVVPIALILSISACNGDSGSTARRATTLEPAATVTSTPPPPAILTSEGCTPSRPHEGGTFDETLTSGGLEREYILSVPPSYSGEEAVPLVFNLHGYSSNAQQQALYSGLPAKAEEEGFLVVTPQGTGAVPYWNFLGIETDGPDDVAFFDELLDSLLSQLCIDPARVYAAGISNGAAMSVTLACRLSGRIAAIAPVAGVFFLPGCPSDGPVSVIAFHGTEDALVPFEGGTRGSLPVPPVEQSVRDWAGHNGCAEGAERAQVTETVRLVRYEECEQGAAVELYAVDGGGHTWPGAAIDVPPLGTTTREISATDLMWDFFAAHPRR